MRDRVYIIAEAGVNHNGSYEKAKELVDKAKWAGADAVKFQLFKSGEMTSVKAQKAQYQKDNTEEGESQLEMLRKLELNHDTQLILKEYAEEIGIDFLTSPFDMKSLEEVIQMKLKYIKIPSGEITNYPLLKGIAESGDGVILSTGMCEISEIRDAIDVLEVGCKEIILLHCNTEYPTPMEDVNLSAMKTMEKEFGKKVGYSDHTLGIEVPTAAVALGAVMIEKHFTLDKEMDGPDHKASLNPLELKSMVEAIRNIERAMGDGVKKPSESEEKNKGIARKSIVASCSIKMGEVFTAENITCKRPGIGLTPMLWKDIVGKKSKRDYSEDELLSRDEVL